jgi:hypothetical protein
MTKDEEVKVLKEWVAYGLRCKILVGPVGSLNGYVAVPKTHSAWGIDYDKISIDVHGGLTFGQQGNATLWNDPDLYWFGFDTAHAGDWVNYSDRSTDHKWTLNEVIKETTYMAKQFAEMKTKVFLDYSAKATIREFFGDEVLNDIMLGKVPTKTPIVYDYNIMKEPPIVYDNNIMKEPPIVYDNNIMKEPDIEENIYIDMSPKISGTFVMIKQEKWEKIKALSEKWRNDNSPFAQSSAHNTQIRCADELDEELK